VIVDVRRLAELPLGTTALLALSPDISIADLDWLNLNRPVLAERRLNVVLWCERGVAAALSQRAPDFFDWISVRVDCPPAPVAHAVADVKRAIYARAAGIAWEGPGLEETLAAVRPGRPIRRVAVASYQSMIDALTSREPGWLFLEGIDTAIHLRRLRWAMAETGRRVIVFRRALEKTAPGWWTVHATHIPITEAVHSLAETGGTGRLAALTGLDPEACLYVRFALRHGIVPAHLETLLASSPEPGVVLECFARLSGWTAAEVLADAPRQPIAAAQQAVAREAARHVHDDDPIVSVLGSQKVDLVRWAEAGSAALPAGDTEVAIRWLTTAQRSLPADVDARLATRLHTLLGITHRGAGNLASARIEFELASSLAHGTGDVITLVEAATGLASVLLTLGELRRSRECLETALRASEEIGGEPRRLAPVLDMLAMTLLLHGDPTGARLHLERSLSIKRSVYATEDHPQVAQTLDHLGFVLTMQGELESARSHLERSLDIKERLLGPDHPHSVTTLRRLAAVYMEMRDTGRARACLERALAIERIASGTDEHPSIAEIFVDMARVLAADGDLIGARELLERALATQQRILGDDGQLEGAATRRSLAEILVAMGDLAGAREHLERALATQRRIFGSDVATDAPPPVIERMLSSLRKVFPGDAHPVIALTLRELERVKQLQGELEHAD